MKQKTPESGVLLACLDLLTAETHPCIKWGDVVRFASHISLDDDCWVWTGAKLRRGYGSFHFGGKGKAVQAHKFGYWLGKGVFADGLELDHLCRNHSCVNPQHLEAITHAENIRRGNGGSWCREKTHCKNGHAFDEANTRYSKGRRHCRKCSVIAVTNRRKRLMAEGKPYKSKKFRKPQS